MPHPLLPMDIFRAIFPSLPGAFSWNFDIGSRVSKGRSARFGKLISVAMGRKKVCALYYSSI